MLILPLTEVGEIHELYLLFYPSKEVPSSEDHFICVGGCVGDHPTTNCLRGEPFTPEDPDYILGQCCNSDLSPLKRSLHFKPFKSHVVAVKSISIMESLKFDLLHWKSASGFMDDSNSHVPGVTSARWCVSLLQTGKSCWGRGFVNCLPRVTQLLCSCHTAI